MSGDYPEPNPELSPYVDGARRAFLHAAECLRLAGATMIPAGLRANTAQAIYAAGEALVELGSALQLMEGYGATESYAFDVKRARPLLRPEHVYRFLAQREWRLEAVTDGVSRWCSTPEMNPKNTTTIRLPMNEDERDFSARFSTVMNKLSNYYGQSIAELTQRMLAEYDKD